MKRFAKVVLLLAVGGLVGVGILVLVRKSDPVHKAKLHVAPAVVDIVGYDEGGQEQGRGRGFVVNANVVICTTYHAIHMARTIKARFLGGLEVEAKSVLTYDANKDFALIQIPRSNLPVVEFGNSGQVRIGDPVAVTSGPLGSQSAVTPGTIGQVLNDTLQIATAVSPGNSGAPVSNVSGKVIGMVGGNAASGQDSTVALTASLIQEAVRTALPGTDVEKFYKEECKRGQSRLVAALRQHFHLYHDSNGTFDAAVPDNWTVVRDGEPIVIESTMIGKATQISFTAPDDSGARIEIEIFTPASDFDAEDAAKLKDRVRSDWAEQYTEAEKFTLDEANKTFFLARNAQHQRVTLVPFETSDAVGLAVIVNPDSAWLQAMLKDVDPVLIKDAGGIDSEAGLQVLTVIFAASRT